MNIRRVGFSLTLAALCTITSAAMAQDLAKIVTKADVEKVTGARFKDATRPMPEQMIFVQEGGDLMVSIDLEARDAGSTVRAWAATIKEMDPRTKVLTISGVGKDAIYSASRADTGALSADFDKPRVQLRVDVTGATTPAMAKQIVIDLARIAGPRVGK